MLGPAPSIAASNSQSVLSGARKLHPNSSASLLMSCRFRNSYSFPHARAPLYETQPKWHFVYQCFQSARVSARAGKIRMRPSPEIAMPVSTIVSLNSDPQRASVKTPPIQRDPARKDSIGMRGSREADPAFIAERDAKRRTIIQIPCNCVPLNFEYASTGILADLVLADSKVEGILAFATEIQSLQGKSLNEALRLPAPGNQVAHTCTGMPPRSPVQPPRPGFISKYRNHHAPESSASRERGGSDIC